jgi:RNA polymerase sigma-70 factor (ECF subfamily)
MLDKLRRALTSNTGDDEVEQTDVIVSPDHEEIMELVDAAKKDPAAFGALYEIFVDRIYSYIYYKVGNQPDAEDLTARTFENALRAIKRFNSRGVPFSAWLYRIAHNLVANYHRDHDRRPQDNLDDHSNLSDLGISPAGIAENQELREALFAAIRRLPDDRQQLIPAEV